jgi:hypothetical protein
VAPERIRLGPSSKRISSLVKKQLGEIVDKVKGNIRQAASGRTGNKKLKNEGKDTIIAPRS